MCDQFEKKGSVFTQLHSASERGRSENLNAQQVCNWLMKHEVAHTTNCESSIDGW